MESFFVVLGALLALSINACLQPSGEPKKDVPDQTDDQPPPVDPQDPPPVAPKPGNDDASPAGPTILPPLKLSVVMKSPRGGYFDSRIAPILEKSCTVGGCHAASMTIDLRSFPFQAEGSYALDDIVADIGPNPDPHEVQKRLVQVLISSMQTGYMPPADHDPVSERERGFFEQWLADELPVTSPPFTGKFHLKGMFDQTSVCETTLEMTANVLDGMIEREPCKKAERIEFAIVDSADQTVASGQMSFQEFTQLKKWNLVFDP